MDTARRVRTLASTFFLLASVLAGTHAQAFSPTRVNFVDLLRESNAIVVGRVQRVTDGVDEKGVPYTEVTLNVAETIRGSVAGVYTFRQFGLLKPRPTPDGRRVMMSSPPGFPQYVPGETTLLFLRPAAKWTGFRMPAGVTAGKFKLGAGRAENDAHNAGLFYDVRLEGQRATDEDRRILSSTGALNPDAFLAFVRRAVNDRWAESGRIRYATETGPINVTVPPADVIVNTKQPAEDAPAAADAPVKFQDPLANHKLLGAGR